MQKEYILDASDDLLQDTTLPKYIVDKIFPEGIPISITPAPYYREQYCLQDIIDHLNSEFAEWVQTNCHFRKVRKSDIENGECFEGAEVGDRMLSEIGMQQFADKLREYQNRLEVSGFTYQFKGGLYWD